MKTVLLIEDEPWLIDGYLATLKHAGYKVIIARDPQAAIEAIDDHPVDVVVLDIFLPVASGLQFLHELRSYADTHKMPVIVCSSAVKDLPAASLSAFGVSIVLDKTVLTPKQLVTAVKGVL